MAKTLFTLTVVECILLAATVIQAVAIFVHWKLARWTGWILPFLLYGIVFVTMLLPRILSQMILYDVIPPGSARTWSALIFLFDSALLYVAGIKLWDKISRDIASVTDPEYIIEIDCDGTILFLNKAMCNLLGYRRRELVGANIQKVMPERYRARHRAAFDAYVASGKRTLDWSSLRFSMLDKNNVEIPVEITFTEFQWLASSDSRYGERRFRAIIKAAVVEGESGDRLSGSPGHGAGRPNS